MALACEKHYAWLDPVAVSRLRQIRTFSDIERLPRKNTAWSPLERRREALLNPRRVVAPGSRYQSNSASCALGNDRAGSACKDLAHLGPDSDGASR